MSIKSKLLFLFPFLFAASHSQYLSLVNPMTDYGNVTTSNWDSPQYYTKRTKFKGYMRENRRFNSFNKKKK